FDSTQVIGLPDVYPEDGDKEGSWRIGENGPNEYIQVQFNKSVYISGIEIYETFNAGMTQEVLAHDGSSWVSLWSTTSNKKIDKTRIFSPPLQVTNFLSNHIRINVDGNKEWPELDAIRLHGK
ncbi:FBXL4-like protein, partial [Mya arenaria]